MVETKHKKCPECGAVIAGFGDEHLDRNYQAHLKQGHSGKEKVKAEPTLSKTEEEPKKKKEQPKKKE